jgi:hypothetical protein
MAGVGTLIILVLCGGLYFFSQSPQIALKPPAGIDVRLGEYHASITNRSVCEAILAEFRRARRVLTVSKFAGRVGIRYQDGTTQEFFLTIHDNTFWIGGVQVFAGDAERVRALLKEGGIDVSKFSDG